MSAITCCPKCLKVRLILGLFLIIAPQNTFAETKAVPPAVEQAEAKALNILPTLKGHMARLGSLMNILFRDVDDPQRQRLVLETLQEMIFLLENVRKNFVPTKVAELSDNAERATAFSGFQSCAQGARALLEKMITHVRRAETEKARLTLYALDKKRRACHSRYAGQ